jgi:hypothetical protein
MKVFPAARMVNVAIAVALVAIACQDLPPVPRIDERVATIRFVQAASSMIVEQDAVFIVEARNGSGQVIRDPGVVWSSTNTFVAVTNGSGSSATVTAMNAGTTRIRAASANGAASVETNLRVNPRDRE